MEELTPLSFSVFPSHTSAILFRKMVDTDYVLTEIPTSSPVTRIEFDDAPPVPSFTKETLQLSPHQAFAKRSPKSTGSMRFVARRKKPQSLQKNVLVVDDVHDVTEMIALFLKHAGYEVATADSA